MLIGYARVSKADGSQSLDLQRDALQAAGVDAGHVSHDVASGVRDDRPGLDSCVRALRSERSRHLLIGDSGRSGRLGVPRRWCADSARWASSGRHVDHRDRRRVMISM